MARELARKVPRRHGGKISRLPRANASGRRRRAGAPGSRRPVVVSPQATAPPILAALPMPAARRRRAVHLANGLALVAVLALALGASWSDGLATADNGLPAQGLPSDFTAAQVPGNDSRSRGNFIMAGSNVVPPEPAVPKAPPYALLIPALDVHRAVEPVGADRSGVLHLPVNAWNAGWYVGSPVPGAPGDSVIEGHAGYPGQPMIFGRLISLKPGDRIIVVLDDGTRQLFLVDSMKSIAVGTAPPGMAEPYGPPRLTLITCTGHFDKNSYSYTQRLVLEAHYAGLA